jgi:PD-(D/E)XK endonuclease
MTNRNQDSLPKSNPKITNRNTTQTGDFSEAAFLLKATSLGFGVAKPWSNSERYDFILDNGSRLWRVQVKCTASLRARGYDVQPIRAIYTRELGGKSKFAYTAEDVDALVAHIVPVDAWYVLPIADIINQKSLRFYPDNGCPRARFEKYREAWTLFRT